MRLKQRKKSNFPVLYEKLSFYKLIKPNQINGKNKTKNHFKLFNWIVYCIINYSKTNINNIAALVCINKFTFLLKNQISYNSKGFVTKSDISFIYYKKISSFT